MQGVAQEAGNKGQNTINKSICVTGQGNHTSGGGGDLSTPPVVRPFGEIGQKAEVLRAKPWGKGAAGGMPLRWY